METELSSKEKVKIYKGVRKKYKRQWSTDHANAKHLPLNHRTTYSYKRGQSNQDNLRFFSQKEFTTHSSCYIFSPDWRSAWS